MQTQYDKLENHSMAKEPKITNRFTDTPRDKPVSERTEHANLDRPGAQAHPKAGRGWHDCVDPAAAWQRYTL
jgi:hypothetical protein